jgi:hypothetical protein
MNSGSGMQPHDPLSTIHPLPYGGTATPNSPLSQELQIVNKYSPIEGIAFFINSIEII